MTKYKLYNNLTGWITFLIAATVYLLTIEPTASWWDCSEFITTAYRMEVGHPPGAPLFMIIGRFFTLFAGHDVTKVAIMVNILSALMSAFTILFLFWTITHLARKILAVDGQFTKGKMIVVLGSGLIGALAYTFSDTFWFSAVEAEVYGSSSFFTAIVFWAILKWEDVADEKYANRWIILIAYLTGLSIGIHLLNLLAIPAMVFVYYFRKYKVSTKGIVYALLISLTLLGGMMYGVIAGLIKVASYFELLFVNDFGLPFNSGITCYALLLLIITTWGIYITRKKKKVVLNTILSAFVVILIGYSSYAMIVIRSLSDPPINENNPDNVFSLMYYLNREQYGDNPLIYGPCFSAPIKDREPSSEIYSERDGKYVVTSHRTKYIYDDQLMGFFPRMYSTDPSHIEVYKDWADIKGTKVITENENKQRVEVVKPTLAENLRFFVTYQVGYMYFRYFMWNFAGKQNDSQGHGGCLKGNWLSGISFIDQLQVGPQKNLPESLKLSKSRNRYYFLPLILGLFGMFFHFQKHKKDAVVIMLLFFMTGLAIVIYLNQSPLQARERDYAYAGSFYAFAIWIGLGTLSLFEVLKKKTKEITAAAIVTGVCLLLVPSVMAKENWDDHDRSGRFTVRDFASNYLNSCAPNAILFTNGDNDTFPLWYAQQVEGIRPDVRIVNLMLLNMDWYIDQMKTKAFQSEPLPISLKSEKYTEGTRDVIYFFKKLNEPIGLAEAIEFVNDDSERTKYTTPTGEIISYLPSNSFKLKVDSLAVLKNHIISENLSAQMVKNLEWTVKRSYLTKSDLILLDILSNNKWERPVYFTSIGHEGCLDLDNYLQLEGLAYRLVPLQTKAKDYNHTGRINTDIMFDNMMNKFKWGRMEQPGVLMDHFNIRMLSMTGMRANFARLAVALSDEGKNDSAIRVLDRCMKLTPKRQVPFDSDVIEIINGYYKARSAEKANSLLKDFAATCEDDLRYYYSLNSRWQDAVTYEREETHQILKNLQQLSKQYGQVKISDDLEKAMGHYQR
jgi:hypothetical protein